MKTCSESFDYEVEVRGFLPSDQYLDFLTLIEKKGGKLVKKEDQENVYCDGTPWQIRLAGGKAVLIAKSGDKNEKERRQIEINLKEAEDFYKLKDAFKTIARFNLIRIPRTRFIYSLPEYPDIVFAIDHYQSFDIDFSFSVFELEEITTEEHIKEIRTKLERIATDFGLKVFSDEVDIALKEIIQRIEAGRLKIRELLTIDHQKIIKFLSSIGIKTNAKVIDEFKNIQSALYRSEAKI